MSRLANARRTANNMRKASSRCMCGRSSSGEGTSGVPKRQKKNPLECGEPHTRWPHIHPNDLSTTNGSYAPPDECIHSKRARNTPKTKTETSNIDSKTSRRNTTASD